MNAVTESPEAAALPAPPAPVFAIPQIAVKTASALEVRDLRGGVRLLPSEVDAEVAALNAANEDLGYVWRLETRAELAALLSLTKNGKGAYSVDESIEPAIYWTGDQVPSDPRVRFVVGFGYGSVDGYDGSLVGDRFRARAVRVPRQ